MARLARVVFPGYPHHITHNNEQPVNSTAVLVHHGQSQHCHRRAGDLHRPTDRQRRHHHRQPLQHTAQPTTTPHGLRLPKRQPRRPHRPHQLPLCPAQQPKSHPVLQARHRRRRSRTTITPARRRDHRHQPTTQQHPGLPHQRHPRAEPQRPNNQTR